MSLVTLALLFFIIAVIYSLVGFGGGSSYIAILLLGGLAQQDIRLIALVCNILVVAGASIHYQRARLLPWKKIFPLIIVSVPLAFLGGTVELTGNIYKIIAAVALIIASILILTKSKTTSQPKTYSLPTLAATGGGIGLLSGVIGIGGGIFLAPLLHIINWDRAKVISATASMFILVNSVAGIAGQLTNTVAINWIQLFVLGGSVLLGGQLGSQLNINILRPKNIKIMTAILVGFVGARILWSVL